MYSDPEVPPGKSLQAARQSSRVGAKRSGKNQNTKVTLCVKSFAAHFWIAGMVEFRSSLSEAIGEIPIECREQTFCK